MAHPSSRPPAASPEQRTPVVLLVFANDRYDGGGSYLRNLAREQGAVRDALRRATDEGACELVVEFSLTLRELFDLLDRYGDRAIGVHFGGHADPEGLRLEDDERRPVAASMDGIARRLAGVHRLRWVFLNGCGTAAHVEALHALVEAPVIATSTAVRDSVAADFARRFYHGLGLGKTIAEAFANAESEARTAHHEPSLALRDGHAEARFFTGVRAVDPLRMLAPVEDDGRWPWVLALPPGREGLGQRTLYERTTDVAEVVTPARLDAARSTGSGSSSALDPTLPGVFGPHGELPTTVIGAYDRPPDAGVDGERSPEGPSGSASAGGAAGGDASGGAGPGGAATSGGTSVGGASGGGASGGAASSVARAVALALVTVVGAAALGWLASSGDGCEVPWMKGDAAVDLGQLADGAVPDVAVPDVAVPDAAAPDARLPDARLPDARLPDAARTARASVNDGRARVAAALDRALDGCACSRARSLAVTLRSAGGVVPARLDQLCRRPAGACAVSLERRLRDALDRCQCDARTTRPLVKQLIDDFAIDLSPELTRRCFSPGLPQGCR